MYKKSERQKVLTELLDSQALCNQQEVVEAMNAQGFEVTQPSVSRDFKELGVVKAAGRYRVLQDEVAPKKPLFVCDPLSLIKDVRTAGPHLIVINTEVGAANVVAAAIDRMANDEVVGSIAGDDAIFLAAETPTSQDRILRALQAL